MQMMKDFFRAKCFFLSGKCKKSKELERLEDKALLFALYYFIYMFSDK